MAQTIIGITIHFEIREHGYGYEFTAEHTQGKYVYDGFLSYEEAAESAGKWLERFLKEEKE